MLLPHAYDGKRNNVIQCSGERSMVVTSGQPQDAGTRLRGGWLVLARSAWVALAVLSLVYFVATMPGEFARLERVCASATCTGIDLTPAEVRELTGLGTSARFYAAYLVTAKFISAMVWLATGTVIFWRKPDDRIALFVSLTLVVGGGIAFGGIVDPGAAGSSAWAWVAVVLSFLGNTAIFTFFFIFPDGRFVPRWTGVVALAGALLNVSFFFFPHWSVSQWLSSFLFVVSTPFWIIALLAQVYRCRRGSPPPPRPQTK